MVSEPNLQSGGLQGSNLGPGFTYRRVVSFFQVFTCRGYSVKISRFKEERSTENVPSKERPRENGPLGIAKTEKTLKKVGKNVHLLVRNLCMRKVTNIEFGGLRRTPRPNTADTVPDRK